MKICAEISNVLAQLHQKSGCLQERAPGATDPRCYFGAKANLTLITSGLPQYSLV